MSITTWAPAHNGRPPTPDRKPSRALGPPHGRMPSHRRIPPHAPTVAYAPRPSAAYDLGLNVVVNVRQVSLRKSPLHSDALAVYINAYPCRGFTTNPRSIDRYFVPLST